MLPDIKHVESIVKNVADEEILPRFNQISYSIKDDGSLLTEADTATDKRIQTALAKYWPDIAFLSEEMTSEEQETLLNNSPKLWCLDPLDGTSNFAAGIPLFATSLTLFENGKVVMAITYDPFRNEMFSAQSNKGAWLNDQEMKCVDSDFQLQKSVAIVDFKRLTPALANALLTQAPYSSQRNLGTCVLEWAWMAANRGHAYLHGGMKLWDLAAGTLILKEAGGFSSTIDGEEVFKPAMKPRSVVASPDKEIFEQWLEYIQKHNA